MISPTCYNCNFFSPPSTAEQEVQCLGVVSYRLVKEDGFRNVPIFPFSEYPISLQLVFTLWVDFECFSELPSFHSQPPPSLHAPRYFVRWYSKSHFLLCAYVHVPTLFSLSSVSWYTRLFNLGQWWQEQPGQTESKPGSHPGRQAVIHCSGSPAAPRRSPLYRRDIKRWIIYASPAVPSLLPPSHVALMPGQLPACCCLHLKWMIIAFHKHVLQ